MVVPTFETESDRNGIQSYNCSDKNRSKSENFGDWVEIENRGKDEVFVSVSMLFLLLFCEA